MDTFPNSTVNPAYLELQRRYLRVMNTDVIVALSLEERGSMREAIRSAPSFEKLPERYKNLIQQGERERELEMAGIRKKKW